MCHFIQRSVWVVESQAIHLAGDFVSFSCVRSALHWFAQSKNGRQVMCSRSCAQLHRHSPQGMERSYVIRKDPDHQKTDQLVWNPYFIHHFDPQATEGMCRRIECPV